MRFLRLFILAIAGFLPALAALHGGKSGMVPEADNYKAPLVCTLGHYRGPVVAMLSNQIQDKENSPAGKAQHHHKAQVHQQIPVQLTAHFVLPTAACYADDASRKAPPLPHAYSYLFFEEINPPPPKSC